MAILGQQNPNTYRTDNIFISLAGQTVYYCHYNPTAIDVYQNGTKLVNTVDFTANDGVSIILLVGALEGDVVEIVAHKVNLHFVEFSNAPLFVSQDVDLTYGQQYVVSASCDLTLPANPLPNHSIKIHNASGTTTVLVKFNNKKIHGALEDLVIDIEDTSLVLTYLNENNIISFDFLKFNNQNLFFFQLVLLFY
jgi:hypothetical protein